MSGVLHGVAATWRSTASSSTVTYIGGAGANTTSVAIPAHQAGDLILVYAGAGAISGATVSAPAAGGTVPPWISIIDANATGLPQFRLAYAVATSSSTTTGTWTNGSRMMALVFRNQQTSSPIGAFDFTKGLGQAYGSGALAPAVTLQDTSGKSTVLHLGHINGTVAQASFFTMTPYGAQQDFNTADYTGRLTGTSSRPYRAVTKNVTTTAPSLQLGYPDPSVSSGYSAAVTVEIRGN